MTEYQRECVARAAARWEGTPFYPHQAIKGVGADCVQLALAIYKDAGVLPIQTQLPEYQLGSGDHLASSIVLKWLMESNLFQLAEGPEVGRLIVLKAGRVEHHVGVVVGENIFIQCIRRYGTVISDLRDSTWSSRVRSYWEPK